MTVTRVLANAATKRSSRDGASHSPQQELEVLPDVLLLLAAARGQQEGGVVGAQDGDALVVVQSAAQPADGLRRAQQVLGGAAAQGHDVLRLDQLDLSLQE